MKKENLEAGKEAIEEKDEILKSEIAHLLDMLPSFGKDLTVIRFFNLFKNYPQANKSTPAIEFVEWIYSEDCSFKWGRDGWYHWAESYQDGYKPISTEQLYKLFNPNWQAKQATPVKRDDENKMRVAIETLLTAIEFAAFEHNASYVIETPDIIMLKDAIATPASIDKSNNNDIL